MERHHNFLLEEKLARLAAVKEFRCTYILHSSPTLTVDWCDAARVKIDVLPDVALLEIFDFYVGKKGHDLNVDKCAMHVWCTLAHVCRKWRDLVFASPRRLRLQLWYKHWLPLKEMLDIWPPLNIAITVDLYSGFDEYNDNIALAHNDRISKIKLWNFQSWQLEEVLAAMHRPFPALSCLVLDLEDDEDTTVSLVPDSFLGGSAPHLQTLPELHSVSGITETTSVRHSPCPTEPLQNSSFRVLPP